MVTPLHSGPWYSNDNVKARKIRKLKKMINKTHNPYTKYALEISLTNMLTN